jgi:hypothetical protein
LAAKVVKTHGVSTPVKTAAPKPPVDGTLWPLAKKKSTFMGSTSNQPIADQSTNDKKKGAADKEVLVDPDDTDKKPHLNMEPDVKFSPKKSRCLHMADIRYASDPQGGD